MVVGARAAEEVELPEIAVVKTIGGLDSQPAFKLGRGITAKFGIESRESPRGSAVIFYCLTEGYRVERRWENGKRVGPVVMIDYSSGLEELAALSITERAERDDEPRGKLLFMKEVVVPNTLPRVVRVSSLEKKPLAQAIVKPVEKPHYPWLAFARGKKLQRVQKQKGADPQDLVVAAGLTIETSGWAVPRMDPMSPVVIEGQGYGRKVKRLKDEKLPNGIPEMPTPGFIISKRSPHGDYPVVLRVASKKEFTQSWPELYFIARWWVNGKPVVGKEAGPDEQGWEGGGAIHSGRHLDLQLEFDRKAIGAKGGDQVAVQVLYATNGWRYAAEESEMLAMENGYPRAMLSNRLEWVVK